MESNVIDYNLLIKCLTILLIVAAVVLVIFKSKWKGLRLKTKYGDVELEQNGSNSQNNNTESKKYRYSNYTLEREFKRIIGKINSLLTKNISDFIIKNELHLKSSTEMENYIVDKIKWFEDLYDDEFKKSEVLKQFSIGDILDETNDMLLQFKIRSSFMSIYNNHIEFHNNIVNLINEHKNEYVSKDFVDKIMKVIVELNLFDFDVINKTLIDVNKILFKSFQDKIK